MEPLRPWVRLVLMGLIVPFTLPLTARAQGYELTTAGARANGRAGANHVGGDSSMSLFYNPANIGRDGADYGVAGALHMHFTHRCMTRMEVVESNGTREAGETFPRVCGEGPPAVLPQLAFTMRLAEGLTLGAGIYVPPAAVRRVRFGDPEEVTFNPNGEPIPTPTRYLLIEQQLLQLFPTIGLGYEVHPRFRLGATFGWGITKVDFTNAAYSRTEVDVPLLDVTAFADARNRLQATDAFVPRLNVGAWGQPVEDLPLELGLSFIWTGNVRTSSGTLQVDSVHPSLDPPLLDADDIQASTQIDNVRLRVPQTSQLAFGVRYAEKLAEAAGDFQDRLSTERFDVELNVVLTFGRRVDQYNVRLPEGSTLLVPSPLPFIVPDTEVELPEEIDLDQRWRTQVALRLGGDYTVIPGELAVRGGLSYLSNGVQGGYQQLNFQPFRQVGVHLGGTYRIAGFLDLSVAYAHIFQPDVRVSPQDANLRRTVGGDADPDDPEDAALVNAGLYTGRHHVLIVEAGARF
jgi:long-subunit fatty acid transport protein